MDILEQQQGAVTVLKPRGPLISDDADAVRAKMLDVLSSSLGRFVIDATGISFVDSIGLELLLDVTEELSKGGNVLKLCGVTDTVREVMDLTDIASHFEHFEDVHTAVRSFL